MLRSEQARRERLELLLELSREVARTLAHDATESGVAAQQRAVILLRALPDVALPVTRCWIAQDQFPEAVRAVAQLAAEKGVTYPALVADKSNVAKEIGAAVDSAAAQAGRAVTLPD